MSITKAMYSGVSGLVAESDTLSVVGQNVANTNTIGFKKSRAIFETVLGGAVGDGTNAGGGVRLGRTQQIFGQGALINTGNSTDLALQGDGFFVVNGTVNGVNDDYFTRAGQFTINNDGKLVNPNGLALRGYAALGDGTYDGKVGTIQLSTAALPPRATKALTMTANVDASATTPTLAWDPQNPGPTSNLSTTVTVYDSLGKGHAVDVYFRRISDGNWDVHVLGKGEDLTGGTAGQNVEIGTGALAFNTSGALTTVTWGTAPSANFKGAKPSQAFTFDFGTPTGSGGTGLDGITNFGSPSAVSAQSQDGYASGDLAGVKVDADGIVSGVYSNGQTVATAKVCVAKFRSNDGLAQVGQNLWTPTRDSGEAAFAGAGDGGRGACVSAALEQSNVDVSEQFVDLIAHQRAFQANSKTITTADQMLQELMTIKQ